MIELDDAAAASGHGAFELDGKMINVPVVIRARRLLARYDKIVQREARKSTLPEGAKRSAREPEI